MKIPILSGLLATIDDALDPQKKRPVTASKASPVKMSDQKPAPVSKSFLPVVTFEQKLEKAQTVSDCMSLYQNYASGSSEEEQVATKAFKIATSFDDYFTILEMSDIESVLAKRAVVRLQNLARTFEEWQRLLDYIKADPSFSEVTTTCLKALVSKASSLEQWLYVYHDSPEHSAEKVVAEAELIKSAQSDDDWGTVVNDLSDTDPLHRRCLEWRLRSADNLESLETLYDELNEDDALVPALLTKLKEWTGDLSDWVERYENHGNKDAFDEVLFAKMLELAQSPDDYITIMEATENCSNDDSDKVIEHLRGLTWDKENWEKLRDDSSDDSGLEHLAFEKLLEFETTTTDILRFYLAYKDGWDEDSSVSEKIFAKLFKVATLQEAEIISLLAENDHDELHEAAEKVVNPLDEETSAESN